MKTYREKFLEKYGIPATESLSLEEIASISGMPIEALKMVYKKGIGAYYTNPISVRMKGSYRKNIDAPMRLKLSPQQWAYARVFSFVMKNPKVFYMADRHIAEKFKLV
jgi:hypothetical protein